MDNNQSKPTNEKPDGPTKQKKTSIFDSASPAQRRVFEKMGMLYKVSKPDNVDDKKQ